MSAVEVPPVPRFRSVFLRGLPGFAREGLVPVALFYVGLKAEGLLLGVILSTAGAAVAYLYERRRGAGGLLVRLSLAFVLVQAGVGLAAHSATVYLAQPVLANAVFGLLYLASVYVGRPLMGAIAMAWYPFPEEVRRSRTFKRTFGVESVVWGLYLLARSGIRLAVLTQGSLGAFLVVNLVTGLPVTFALVAWSVWYAIRAFERTDEFD
jgi:intracellular septation protein A